MILVRQHNQLLLPINIKSYSIHISSESIIVIARDENHIANTNFMSHSLVRSFVYVSSKHFHYTSEWMYVNSLSNLRCLFMSHRHKSVYWQPINNYAFQLMKGAAALYSKHFFFNITFRFAHRITSKFNPKPCDICSNTPSNGVFASNRSICTFWNLFDADFPSGCSMWNR